MTRPADVVIDEAGQTWVRVEAHGLAVLVNEKVLREPFEPGPISLTDWDLPRPERVPDLAALRVLPPAAHVFFGGGCVA